MKKIAVLLILMAGLFSLQAQQPGTLCDARFSFSVSAGNQVQFMPLAINTSALLQHRWYFGDGSPSSAEPAPAHTYQPGQYQVRHEVYYWLPNDSTLLICADSAVQVILLPGAGACTLTPAFTFRRDSLQPNKVYFYNQSTGMQGNTRLRWTFGDGTASDAVNPVHVFTASGLFNVCLTVTDSFCTRERCQPVQVQVPVSTCNLQAYYGAVPDSSNPLKVYFSNLSAGFSNTDTVRWTFGDGTSSGDLNPSHTYSQPGTYTVCLVLKRPQPSGTAPCVREYCAPVTVQSQPPCTLQVSFVSTPSTANPLQIRFTNTSVPLSNTDSIRWTFGDGSGSAELNPVHTYNQGGSYTVCLRVKKAASSAAAPCVREYCQTLTVLAPPPCSLVVGFSSQPSTANPLQVHFSNNSTPLSNTDSIRWTFGDGTSSAELNPVHTFPQAGSYTVCLRVKKVTAAGSAPCVREWCQVIVLTQPEPCNLQVNFDVVRDSVTAGALQAWRFYNTSVPLAATDSCFWSFGDNTPVVVTSGSTPYVLHSFPANGNYNVCLRVKKMLPGSTTLQCERQLCRSIVIQNPPACTLNPRFTWTADSVNPRLVRFSNHSDATPATATVRWTFGDGSSSNEWNPVHEFAQTGLYNVCLTIVLNGTNCMRDSCGPVVLQPAPADSCLIRPAFTHRISSTSPHTVIFTNTSATATAAAQALWSFGDGSSATSWNAEHRYSQPGVHVVCLTLFQGNTCNRTVCDTVRVSQAVTPPVSCDSLRLNFAYRRDAYMPNKLFFFALAPQPLVRQQWVIRRAGDSQQVVINRPDPVYVFPDTGLYNVCLKGGFLNGCEKTHCREIRIYSTALPAQCVLHAYPNPAQGQVSVNVQLEVPGPVTVSVYSMQQILMQRVTTQGVAGNNLITLNVQQLPTGFYTMRIVYGNRVCYARFQKI